MLAASFEPLSDGAIPIRRPLWGQEQLIGKRLVRHDLAAPGDQTRAGAAPLHDALRTGLQVAVAVEGQHVIQAGVGVIRDDVVSEVSHGEFLYLRVLRLGNTGVWDARMGRSGRWPRQ